MMTNKTTNLKDQLTEANFSFDDFPFLQKRISDLTDTISLAELMEKKVKLLEEQIILEEVDKNSLEGIKIQIERIVTNRERAMIQKEFLERLHWINERIKDINKAIVDLSDWDKVFKKAERLKDKKPALNEIVGKIHAIKNEPRELTLEEKVVFYNQMMGNILNLPTESQLKRVK